MTVIEKEKKQKLQWFFIIEFLLCAVIVFTTTKRIDSLASAAFTGSFLLLVAWFVKLVMLDGRQHHLALVFVIVVLSTVCTVVSAMLNEEAMTMAYFTSHLVFLSTILFVFVIMNTPADVRSCRAILAINVLIACIYPIAYYLFPQERRFGIVDLNFSNPNLTAMWLLQAVMYAATAVVVLKSVFWRGLALVTIPINVWLIFQTEARNGLIAVVLFGALCTWVTLKQRSHFSKALVAGVNLVPILFVPLYMAYVDVVIEKGWFAFLIKEGKRLDSRVEIWQNGFEAIEGLWLIGNYSEMGGNTHNSHMVLLCSYGAIILVLGTWLLYTACSEINAKAASRKNLYALAAFFGVLFMGIGEGSLFSGGVGLFIEACGFLYIARCDFGTDREHLPWWQKKSQRKK